MPGSSGDQDETLSKFSTLSENNETNTQITIDHYTYWQIKNLENSLIFFCAIVPYIFTFDIKIINM